MLVLTSSTFDLGPAPGQALTDGVGCFRASAGGAVPALIVAALLVARAFPLRPGIAGALYGLGCGLIADAGLRLYCEYTAPPHVAFAHGGAILGAMFVGVLHGVDSGAPAALKLKTRTTPSRKYRPSQRRGRLSRPCR